MEKYICERCNGEGFLTTNGGEKHDCPKCLGKIELNWIENIFGVEQIHSALDRLNVRQLMSYIQKTIGEHLEKNIFDQACRNSNSVLQELKSKKAFYDYQMDVFPDRGNISVYIRPNLALEVVRIDFQIKSE